MEHHHSVSRHIVKVTSELLVFAARIKLQEKIIRNILLQITFKVPNIVVAKGNS
jgi:hypothetical protein